jgi:lipid-binding SYLF domain-containing protein
MPISRRALALAGVATFLLPAAARADAVSDAQATVGSADRLVRRLRGGKNGAKVQGLLRAARGALIVPDIVRAGFLVGGETGSGVMLARDAGGKWSNPVFVQMSSGSYGFQAGIKRYHMLMIVMKETTVRQMAEFGAQFGTHMSLAAGDKGYDGSLINTTDLLADAYTFFETDIGAFGGGALQGSALTPRADINAAVFGKSVTPQDILFGGRLPTRKGALKLIEALTVA